MAYYLDLFSPSTYDAFLKSDKTISGFNERQESIALSIKPGDKFICYITKLSRWSGILEVQEPYFVDNSPIFTDVNDPYIIRFKVRPLICLSMEHAVPINDPLIWDHLSFTRNLQKGNMTWTGRVRGSMRKISDEDGAYLEKVLLSQNTIRREYEISEQDRKKLQTTTVKTQDSKQVSVSIPVDDEHQPANDQSNQNQQRESIRIQGLLAEIGERMGMKIWIPRNDRQRVFDVWKPSLGTLLEVLPLNYDDVTLKTIENIDVLWIKGRSIRRAFEVEHTTSIYSGILRMADLMALQPNVNIAAHIVAPIERKEKVLQEISRPVFAFLEKGPLSESCTFISYDSVHELSREKMLEHMSDSVVDEYGEYAEDFAN
jgi:predicted RNA-binding protein